MLYFKSNATCNSINIAIPYLLFYNKKFKYSDENMALLMKIIESVFWQTINNNASIYHTRNLYIQSDRNIKLKWFFHYNDEKAFNVMKGYISIVNLGIRIF